MKKFLTLIRRELWEHKTGFISLPIMCTVILSVLLNVAFIRFAPHPDSSNQIGSSSATLFTSGSTPSSNSTFTSTTTTQPSVALPSAKTTILLTQDSPTDSENLDRQFSVFSTLPTDQLPLFSQINALKSCAGFVGFSLYVLSALLVTVMLIVSLNYAHRTLFDDRKNREILFWRSMPVSETQNLAVKLFMIYGMAPIITVALIFLGAFLCWLVAVSYGSNGGAAALGIFMKLFKTYKNVVLLLFALLPIITWSLLASACARKSPFMLSTFLPIGLMFADRLANWTMGINFYIRSSINGYGEYLAHFIRTLQNDADTVHISTSLSIIFISSFFIIATIWLRNNRYEI